ncbi:MAG TPA: FAD:protein FMN transferase [Chromatiaceae bacterium]|nr:FAD:protein FMN transferase [Chromatiaceae bacterium]
MPDLGRQPAPPSPRTPAAALALAAALVAAMLGGCSDPQNTTYERDILVFGTLAHLTLYGVPESQAVALADAVDARLQEMHRTWHAWQPSEVTTLNAAVARSEPFQVSPGVAELIAESQTAYRASEGLFNPAAGHLFALWGFHQDEPPKGPPPSREAVAAVVAEQARMDDLTLDGNTVTSRNPQVALDFGGIAKGYAGQAIIAWLRTQGVENAIFNAGGGLQVVGGHGDRPWRIGIRGPDGSGVLGAVDLGPQDEAMHTSGNYERYREYDGKRYQHIIDPRSGLPAEHIVSASVIHPNGANADAAATALVIAGPEGWEAVARRMGVTHAILVDHQGTVYLTPQMQGRVQFQTPPARLVIGG